jgi:hypothetical protein
MLRLSVLVACAIGAVAVSSASGDGGLSSAAGRRNPRSASARGGDNAANSALVATDTSLWWFEGYCRIGKMYKAKAVYVQAHCGGN